MGSAAVARINCIDDLRPAAGGPDPRRAERDAGGVRDRVVLDGAAGAHARADEPVGAARARPPDAAAARIVDRHHRAERSVQHFRRLSRDDHSAGVAWRQMGADRRGAGDAGRRTFVLRHYAEDVRAGISVGAGLAYGAAAGAARRPGASVRAAFHAAGAGAASGSGFRRGVQDAAQARRKPGAGGTGRACDDSSRVRFRCAARVRGDDAARPNLLARHRDAGGAAGGGNRARKFLAGAGLSPQPGQYRRNSARQGSRGAAPGAIAAARRAAGAAGVFRPAGQTARRFI